MKRTIAQARSPSLSQGIQQTPHISATTSQPDGNAQPRVFTVDELRNMPRPPGDYSSINTDSCLDVAIFLKHGEMPEAEFAQEQIYIFCINNKLADALSYLCVKHNLHKLKLPVIYSMATSPHLLSTGRKPFRSKQHWMLIFLIGTRIS